MIIELLILAGLFLIFIGMLMLIIESWLEAREYNKQSKRLEESFRKAKDGR
tara:strand:+ start:354 stop:506 length:153 start_codon:yes stop_codon:yes gene_type:complete